MSDLSSVSTKVCWTDCAAATKESANILGFYPLKNKLVEHTLASSALVSMRCR